MSQNAESNKDEFQLHNIHFQIQKLEEKSWYGTALLIIVSGLILISTLMHSIMGFDESTPIVILNGVLIIVHMILVYLSKSDKLKANIGGLLAFLIYLILNLMLIGQTLVGGWGLAGVIVLGYLYFIGESYKLRKLRKKLDQ